MAQKDKVKELVGRSLDSYHTKALQQMDRIEKKNKEQNHKINILTSELDNDYLTKTEEGSVVSLEHSKEGMIYLDELQGNTLVNYCTDSAKELTLNGDIDVEGTNVTLTEGVDNGLVDVVCEGNTLVNIASIGSEFLHKNATSWYRDVSLCEISSLKLNQDYTFIIEKEYLDNHNSNYNEFQIGIGDLINTTNGHPTMTVVSGNFKYNNDKIEKKVVVVRFTDFKDGKYLSCRPARRNNAPAEGESANYHIKVIILEGDWTNKEIPPYFEGMKSVGELENNKLEILSHSKNLTNTNVNDWEVGSIEGRTGENTQATNRIRTKDYFKLPLNSKYLSVRYFDDYKLAIRFFKKDKTMINGENKPYQGFIEITTIQIPDGAYYYRLVCARKLEQNIVPSEITNCKCQLVMGDTQPIEYTSYGLNKKEISLNEPLRGLPSGVKDYFIKQGGKWYIQRNVGEYIFKGNEINSSQGSVNETNLLYWNNAQSTLKNKTDVNEVLSDKLPHGKQGTSNTKGIEGISFNSSGMNLLVDIKKTMAETNEFLKDSKIIYQLATPIYEEITDVELITYLDTTHISNNSTIPCNMVVKNSGYNAIIKPSTQYTVAFDTNKSGTIGLNLGGAKVTTTNNVSTITTPSTLTDDSLRLYGKGIKASKVRLLEEDKTNWIPSYFEGMKSSFEDKLQEDGTYKMEIISNNGNLINLEEQVRLNKQSGMSCSLKEYNGVMSWQIHTQPYIEYYNYLRYQYKPNTQYTMYFDCNMTPYDDRASFSISVTYENGQTEIFAMNKDTKNVQFTTLENRTVKRIYFSNWQYSGYVNIYNMKFCEGSDVLVEEKSNKIQFSSIEPLRGIGDVKDRFVFKDGKLMIERNTIKIVLNGSEAWGIYPNQINRPLKSKCYYMVGYDKFDISDNNSVCDIFSNVEHCYNSADINCFSDYHTAPNKYFTSFCNTLEEFKEYLKNNNATLVGKIKKPTYEEIPFELQKIILEGYENGTLSFDTNIPPTSTVTYSGETPIVKSVRLNKTEVLNNTNDINDNIVPYLMDMDYRVVCLQLEGGAENISLARLFGGTYEMLQRDILSNRYSKEEYKHRLDTYLSANKITEDEYTKLGDMLND